MPARPRGKKRPEPTPERPEFALCGRVWMGGKLQPGEVGLDGNGLIIRVAKNVRAARRHDVGQGVILPAATDLHVHFRDPGPPTESENLASGTLQAAFGGVGTVADMPNTSPPVVRRDDIEAKTARARGRLAVDLLIFAALTERSHVENVAGVAGAFKLYLSPTTGLPDPPGPDALPGLLRRVAQTGAALTVHAEDPGSFLRSTETVDGETWSASRPISAEESAVRVLASAPAALRLHFAHITAPSVVDLVRAGGWSCEVTPQHLLLPAELAIDPRWKVNPPLRPRNAEAELWMRFREGLITSYASDHAPHSMEAKARPWSEAPSGMPGVETAVPLMLEKVRTGDLSLEVLLTAAGDHPARWLGLPCGRVMPGHRAHLLVVDFKRRTTVRAAHLHGNGDWTPFEGFEAVFPVEHYHDGELIVDRGEFVGRLAGSVVRPEYLTANRAGPHTDD